MERQPSVASVRMTTSSRPRRAVRDIPGKLHTEFSARTRLVKFSRHAFEMLALLECGGARPCSKEADRPFLFQLLTGRSLTTPLVCGGTR